MPSSDLATTLDRVWQLLELLPSGAPGLTASELLRLGEAECGWQVTKRTIERHLADLLAADLASTVEDPATRKRANEAQHWIANAKRNLNAVRLTTPDALALHLIERVADSLLPPEIVDVLRSRMDSARSKIRQLRKVDPTAGWADKVAVLPDGFALRPPSFKPEILKTLQRALFAGRQVQCDYQAVGAAKPKSYRLEPRALVQRGAVLYVVATRPDKVHGEPRSYCVHRFKAVTLLERAVSGSGFQLKAFLDSGGADFGATGPPIRFRAWVSSTLSKMLAETPLSADQVLKPTKDGAVVTATVRQSWPFESWILSRGQHLRVMEPEALRVKTVERLREAVEGYARR